MERVRVVTTKWGAHPHREFDAVRLGEDEHGHWLGVPAGTLVSRPGQSYLTAQDQLTLVPRDGLFVASFFARSEHTPCEVYVDITTVASWHAGLVTSVDLDLDVLRGWSGRVWVDDEDEFAAHRNRFGYPEEVARLAVRACEAVTKAVRAALPPYDAATVAPWWSAGASHAFGA